MADLEEVQLHIAAITVAAEAAAAQEAQAAEATATAGAVPQPPTIKDQFSAAIGNIQHKLRDLYARYSTAPGGGAAAAGAASEEGTATPPSSPMSAHVQAAMPHPHFSSKASTGRSVAKYERASARHRMRRVTNDALLDMVLHAKTPVKMTVSGTAGVGKSEIARKMAAEWANSKHPHVPLLFLLDLSSITEADVDRDLPTLLLTHTLGAWGAEYAEDLRQFLIANGAQVMLLLDSCDKFNPRFSPALVTILSGQSQDYAKCHLLLMSRPSLIHHPLSESLTSDPTPVTHVNILGMTHHAIRHYIHNFFVTRMHSRPDLATSLTAFLAENPALYSVLHTPFLVGTLCSLWQSHQDPLPTMLTPFVTQLIRFLRFHGAQHHLHRAPAPKPRVEPVIVSPDGTMAVAVQPGPDSTTAPAPAAAAAAPAATAEAADVEVMRGLASLAWNGLIQDKSLFVQTDLDQFLGEDAVGKALSMGTLLQEEVPGMFASEFVTDFRDVTIQQFLAAEYLLNINAFDATEITVFDPSERFDMVWVYAAGMLGPNAGGLLKKIAEHAAGNPHLTLLLIKCFFEAQTPELSGAVSPVLDTEQIDLEGSMVDAAGVAALSWTLARGVGSGVINLRGNDLDEHHVEDVVELLQSGVVKRLMIKDNTWGFATAIAPHAAQHGVALDWESSAAASRFLHGDQTITSLQLSGCGVGPRGAIKLAPALAATTSLHELMLSNNEIGADGVVSLAEALKTNRTLTLLWLSGNRIGDRGAIALANALAGGTSLIHLRVANNDIGYLGASALAAFIRTNTTVTAFGLDGNKIGVTGARSLASAIRVNHTLRQLWLARNGLGSDGVYDLADALHVNVTLTELDLGGNGIGAVGAATLADALAYNSSIQQLGLDDDEMGEAAEAIERALAWNRSLVQRTEQPAE